MTRVHITKVTGIHLAQQGGQEMPMKSICFHCQYVGVGASASRCPDCDHPLIMDLASSALDLQQLFADGSGLHRRTPPPLPGLSAAPRPLQLLMQKRRARTEILREAKRAQAKAERSRARRRAVASVCAASAAIALGLLATFTVML
jgi:hypothetical protein